MISRLIGHRNCAGGWTAAMATNTTNQAQLGKRHLQRLRVRPEPRL